MKFTLFFLLILPFVTKAQISTWPTLNRPHYSIQFPATWTADTSKRMGNDLFLAAPKDSATDKFRENINVMIQQLPATKEVDMDRYVSVSEEQLKAILADCNIIESVTVNDAEPTYHKMVFTGRQGAFQLKIEQYYFVTDDKAYVVTFTAEQDKFADYQTIGEKILQSFKLKN